MASSKGMRAAQKWRERLQNSTQAMTDGVNAVTEAPGQKAAAKQDKLVANWMAKVNDGTWASRVAAVDLPTWKNTMLNKGIPRVAQGAGQAETKVAEAMTDLIAYQEPLQTKIASMPDLTLEDNVQRAAEWIRGMSKYKRR